MIPEFIPYKQALDLKDIMFDEECFAFFETQKRVEFIEDGLVSNSELEEEKETHLGWILDEDHGSQLKDYFQCEQKMCLTAPTYAQGFKWFREKYNLSSWIYNSDMTHFYYSVLKDDTIVKANHAYETYEEAEHACLLKLIKIVKNKIT